MLSFLNDRFAPFSMSVQGPGAEVAVSRNRPFDLSAPIAYIAIMPFVHLSTATHSCPCGCNSPLRLLEGGFEYGERSNVAFRTALMDCRTTGPHVFTQLGSGAWDGEAPETWWTTIHTWIETGNLVTRVVDPVESPFTQALAPAGRLLSRADLKLQNGAMDWACEVAYDISVEHDQISSFILSKSGASP